MVSGKAKSSARKPPKAEAEGVEEARRSRKRHAAAAVSDGPDEAELDTAAEESNGAVNLATETQTLGQRVAALQVAQPDVSVSAAEEQPDVTKADSLAVLLKQALQSQDASLLARCMGVSAREVIVTTVQRLEPSDAAVLLDSVVKRLQARAVAGPNLVAWLQAVLVHHTAYLMSSPGAQASLASLYRDLEARLALQQPLLSLSGRLDLLMAQRKALGDQQQQPGLATPLVVYKEAELDEPLGGDMSADSLDDESEDESDDDDADSEADSDASNDDDEIEE